MTAGLLPAGVELVRGTRSDWSSFSQAHYVAGKLGPLAAVWLGLDRSAGEPVAFLAYAFPGAGCTGRRRVFGPSHCRGQLAERLPRLNSSLRVLHRLVVLPDWRGLGIGPAMVRATLPLLGVPWVECLAMQPGPLVKAGMYDTGRLAPKAGAQKLRPHYLIWDHPALGALHLNKL